MRKIYTRRTMAGIFILVCTVYFLFAVANKPRILVLHSYDPNYVWVKEVSEGIRSVLDDTPYNVRWHYMDTKRHAEPAFAERAGRNARRMIDVWKPQVVIAVDDHAQQYVASCYVRTEARGVPVPTGKSACSNVTDLSDTPIDIVYTGVNADPDDYGYQDAVNVAGLLQRIPLHLIKAALLETFPYDCNAAATNEKDSEATSGVDCRREVLYLRDASTTSTWREREIMEFKWGPEFRLTSRAVGFLAEWQQEVLDAPKKFSFLLFSDYRKLRLGPNQGLVNGYAVVAWNRSCGKLPMIGLGSSYAETGEALGFSVAPFEQGDVAARMAVDFLEGRDPSDEVISAGVVVYLRGDLPGGHRVPELYHAFAHATGTNFEEAEPVAECDPEAVDLPTVFRE